MHILKKRACPKRQARALSVKKWIEKGLQEEHHYDDGSAEQNQMRFRV